MAAKLKLAGNISHFGYWMPSMPMSDPAKTGQWRLNGLPGVPPLLPSGYPARFPPRTIVNKGADNQYELGGVILEFHPLGFGPGDTPVIITIKSKATVNGVAYWCDGISMVNYAKQRVGNTTTITLTERAAFRIQNFGNGGGILFDHYDGPNPIQSITIRRATPKEANRFTKVHRQSHAWMEEVRHLDWSNCMPGDFVPLTAANRTKPTSVGIMSGADSHSAASVTIGSTVITARQNIDGVTDLNALIRVMRGHTDKKSPDQLLATLAGAAGNDASIRIIGPTQDGGAWWDGVAPKLTLMVSLPMARQTEQGLVEVIEGLRNPDNSVLRAASEGQTLLSAVLGGTNLPIPQGMVLDLEGGSDGAMRDGVSIEDKIAYANLMNIDLRIQFSMWSTRSYHEEVARIVRRTLKPHLKVIIEWADELWNGAWPYGLGRVWQAMWGHVFGDPSYSLDPVPPIMVDGKPVPQRQPAWWDNDAEERGYAGRWRLIGAIWRDAFGGVQQRLVLVETNIQAANPGAYLPLMKARRDPKSPTYLQGWIGRTDVVNYWDLASHDEPIVPRVTAAGEQPQIIQRGGSIIDEATGRIWYALSTHQILYGTASAASADREMALVWDGAQLNQAGVWAVGCAGMDQAISWQVQYRDAIDNPLGAYEGGACFASTVSNQKQFDIMTAFQQALVGHEVMYRLQQRELAELERRVGDFTYTIFGDVCNGRVEATWPRSAGAMFHVALSDATSDADAPRRRALVDWRKGKRLTYPIPDGLPIARVQQAA